jgi:hypothetical protein
LLYQSATLLDAESVIPDLIRNRHDNHKLDTFLNYDTVSLQMAVDCLIYSTPPENAFQLHSIDRYSRDALLNMSACGII